MTRFLMEKCMTTVALLAEYMDLVRTKWMPCQQAVLCLIVFDSPDRKTILEASKA